MDYGHACFGRRGLCTIVASIVHYDRRFGRRSRGCHRNLLWLSNSFARRVGAAAALARDACRKETSPPRINASASDEAGCLLESIRAMVASLRSLVGQVNQSSEQVALTASPIGTASKSHEQMVTKLAPPQ
jgi:hypothetical protein